MKLKLPSLGMAKGGIAGLAMGVFSSLFGGSSQSSNQPTSVSNNFNAPRKSSNSAEYNPLPSFSESGGSVKRISNPTLSDISYQIGLVFSKVAGIQSILSEQFKFELFDYKETARIQKELNAEKKADIAGIGGSSMLGLDMSGLTTALDNLVVSIKNKTDGLGIPGFMAGGPRRGPTGRTLENSKLVKSSEALGKNGKLKPGYEEVKMGKNIRYRKSLPVPKVKGNLGGTIGRVGGRLLTPVMVGLEAYNSWQEIKALPETLTEDERKREITKIVGRLVGSIGLFWAGSALGTMAGSAIAPGPGTLVGLIAGMAGGTAATYVAGESVDELVNTVIDAVYPTNKESVTRTKTVKQAPKKQTQTNITKAPVTTTKKPTLTVGQIIEASSARIGIEASILYDMLNQANPSLNANMLASNATGDQVFKLTSEQWSQISRSYSSSYPELRAGSNNLRSAALASALLARDAKSFLDSNGIGQTNDNLYTTYLLGNKGVDSLLHADSSTEAENITPQAAQVKPEAFKDTAGSSLSVADFLTNTYGVQSSNDAAKLNTTSNIPKVPDRLTPVGGTWYGTRVAWQQGDTRPPEFVDQTTDATPVSAPTPGSMDMPKQESTRPPEFVDQTTDATPISAPTPGNMDMPKQESMPDQETSSATQTSTPNVEQIAPTNTTGSMLESQSLEVEEAELAPKQSVTTISPKTSTSPAILPSQNAGYTGTGNVPDPNFSLGHIAINLFFTSSPSNNAFAGMRA